MQTRLHVSTTTRIEKHDENREENAVYVYSVCVCVILLSWNRYKKSKGVPFLFGIVIMNTSQID